MDRPLTYSAVTCVAVVGVCASGKTTLVNGLTAQGVNARRVLQEHSYVPDMWFRLSHSDLLIYLDAGLPTIRVRRSDPEWPAWLFEQQLWRLRHARRLCDLYLQTDRLTREEVLEAALFWLRERAF